jgi:hypothetical protein
MGLPLRGLKSYNYDKRSIAQLIIDRSGPKIIKLKLETRLKSQASDCLKWRLVAISAKQMLYILVLYIISSNLLLSLLHFGTCRQLLEPLMWMLYKN